MSTKNEKLLVVFVVVALFIVGLFFASLTTLEFPARTIDGCTVAIKIVDLKFPKDEVAQTKVRCAIRSFLINKSVEQVYLDNQFNKKLEKELSKDLVFTISTKITIEQAILEKLKNKYPYKCSFDSLFNLYQQCQRRNSELEATINQLQGRIK
jgi:hypothetical protein